eukprot:TRINITY_DN91384_c0_g1_i1.p1 TRINITY_DN91384_c0_g1~~TRINITY_DN91384_c0_g1_i1.p1  ORF type:complete len:586 (+),score=92.38 TRINITY_DN91384_c0_g1_i1:153-1910(+)
MKSASCDIENTQRRSPPKVRGQNLLWGGVLLSLGVLAVFSIAHQALPSQEEFAAEQTGQQALRGATEATETLTSPQVSIPASTTVKSMTSMPPRARDSRERQASQLTKAAPKKPAHDAVSLHRAEQVREALRHLWRGYKKKAWGSDEVAPISGRRTGEWGHVGMLILDTLDTLWLAGLTKEFAEGEQWVEGLRFLPGESSGRTSVFELTIRALGGLLSAYALSHHQAFLTKAEDLGERLLKAFPRRGENHMWPDAYIDIRRPADTEVVASWMRETILADAGSNILEYTYLSRATGKPQFATVAEENEKRIMTTADKAKMQLAPKLLNPYRAEFSTQAVSVGAFADSYYEYLLKSYVLGGRKDTEKLRAWKLAMQQMRSGLLRKSPGGLFYLAEGSWGLSGVGSSSVTMDHLACFMGGSLALGSHFVPKPDAESWWLPTAKELGRTCYEMYRQSPSGLAPEAVSFEGKRLTPRNLEYRLRPETLETLFYLYRVTGEQIYRDWSWKIFQAINNHTKTEFGFAAATEVSHVPVPLKDSEETFMGAETLKYALLIHLPASTLPLDKYVLNTEAHPLPIATTEGKSLPPL